MTALWPRVLEALDRHGRAAMVTVAATRGSSPREAGARLIVHPDGGFTGTIGGGTLEWRALALAQAALADRHAKLAQVRTFALGPQLGQCCGGSVDLVIELIDRSQREVVADFARREEAGRLVTISTVSAAGVDRQVADGDDMAPGSATLSGNLLREGFGEDRRPLILFGAGHVGRALVLALAPLPFAVTWVDPRPDAFPAFVPQNVSLRDFPDPADAFADAAAATFVLVMTHSHQLDLALVHAALGDDRFPYVGLIGSKSKRARFEHRLAEAGVARDRIAALVCPIGVAGIHSKMPAVIAAATTAELLVKDEALRAAAAPVEHAPLKRAGGR
jgi:xanthine dehydrogenase accessory factor